VIVATCGSLSCCRINGGKTTLTDRRRFAHYFSFKKAICATRQRQTQTPFMLPYVVTLV
jgi:hypothetical protein